MSVGEMSAVLNLLIKRSSEVEDILPNMKQILVQRLEKIQERIDKMKVLVRTGRETQAHCLNDDNSDLRCMFKYSHGIDCPLEIHPFAVFYEDRSEDKADVRLSFLLESFPIKRVNSLRQIDFNLCHNSWFRNENFCYWMTMAGSQIVNLALYGVVNLPQIFYYCPNLNRLGLYDVDVKLLSCPDDSAIYEFVKMVPRNLQHLRLYLSEENKELQVLRKSQLWPLMSKTKSLTLEGAITNVIIGLHVSHSSKKELFFASLEKLSLDRYSAVSNIFLRAFRFPNVKELGVLFETASDASCLPTLLRCFSNTLVTLELITMEDIEEINQEKDDPIQLPLMPKVERFYCLFMVLQDILDGTEIQDVPMLSEDGESGNDDVEMIIIERQTAVFSHSSIIQAMPALKNLKVGAKTYEPQDNEDTICNLACYESECNHIQNFFDSRTFDDILKPIEESPLEKLVVKCSFNDTHLTPFHRISSSFRHLKHLEICINSSSQVWNYCQAISTIQTLAFLEILLTQNVSYLFQAVLHLSKLKSLKTLGFKPKCVFEKYGCSVHRPLAMEGVASAALAFVKFESLETLSFKRMNIEPDEMEVLLKTVSEKKPNLLLIIV